MGKFLTFWPTVLGFIVLLSSGSTWLIMKRGAQEEPVPWPSAQGAAGQGAVKDSSKPAAKAKLTFLPTENQKVDANVILMQAGDSTVGHDSTVEFRFRNDGKNPLTILLVGNSCNCHRGFSVDAKALRQGDSADPKEPGKEGVMQLTWRPTTQQLPLGTESRRERFTLRLYTNDVLHPEVRLEINTRLVHAKEVSGTR